jgi:hypothetical protein
MDNGRTRRALGIEFIPAGKAAVDTAESLLRLGLT